MLSSYRFYCFHARIMRQCDSFVNEMFWKNSIFNQMMTLDEKLKEEMIEDKMSEQNVYIIICIKAVVKKKGKKLG